MSHAMILHILITLLVLIGLEIILGVDNLVFVVLVTNRLPADQQSRARKVGLLLAMITRLILLYFAYFLIQLAHPLFYIASFGVSVRDIFLLFGAIFLWWKSIQEIRQVLKNHAEPESAPTSSHFWKAVIYIMFFDILFSFDSVITAVGVAKEYWVMATAVIVGILITIAASGFLARFINKHIRIKLLALCFLLLVGLRLFLMALHLHVPEGYLYAAIGFSLLFELGLIWGCLTKQT